MKHLWKRVLALMVAATMVFSMAACGGKDDTQGNNSQTSGTESTDNKGGDTTNTGDKKDDRGEPIELTVYSQLANFSGEQVGWFAKLMLDKFNVKLMIIPDSDGVFDTRMESGNLGDIVIFGSTGADYKRAVANDMLFDWEEDDLLSEYGPYIKENIGLYGNWSMVSIDVTPLSTRTVSTFDSMPAIMSVSILSPINAISSL